ERQLATNLTGAVNTMAPLVPRLCERGRGRIVAIASVAAFRGLPNSPGYCASKAGLRAYAEALRPRLMRYGVGVTVVCPGFFASPFVIGAGLLCLASGRPLFAGLVVLALGAGFALADHTMRQTLREPVVFSESVELPQVFSHPHLYLPFAGPGLVLGGAAAAV